MTSQLSYKLKLGFLLKSACSALPHLLRQRIFRLIVCFTVAIRLWKRRHKVVTQGLLIVLHTSTLAFRWLRGLLTSLPPRQAEPCLRHSTGPQASEAERYSSEAESVRKRTQPLAKETKEVLRKIHSERRHAHCVSSQPNWEHPQTDRLDSGTLLTQSRFSIPQNTRALSFSGCSWMLFYHIGVCRAILEASNFGMQPLFFMGTSCGSLIAAMLCTQVEPSLVVEFASKMVKVAHSHLLGPAGKMTHVVASGLEELLPRDAHVVCSGRLFISVTVLRPWPENILISQFESRSDLIRVLLGSCYIPLYYERPCTLPTRVLTKHNVKSHRRTAGEDKNLVPVGKVSADAQHVENNCLPCLDEEEFIVLDGGITNNIPTFRDLHQTTTQQSKHSCPCPATITVSPYPTEKATITPSTPFPTRLSFSPGPWEDCERMMQEGYRSAQGFMRCCST